MSKKTNKANNTPKTDEKTEAKVETCTVAAIARDNGIDPKIARAKLRRIYGADDASPKLPKPITQGKWTFDAKYEAELLELMTSVQAKVSNKVSK